GEAGRIAILPRDQRDARWRRGHRGDVALLIGGHGAVFDRSLPATYVGSGIIAIRPIALAHNSDCVELSRGAEQPCIGNQDFLINSALDLESPGGVAKCGELDEVIPFSTREGDCIPAVLVGAGAAIDVAG